MIAAMGAAVIVGWLFDIAFLKRVVPGLVAMKVNTALCFVLAGIALSVVQRVAARWEVPVVRTLATVIIVVGAVTFAQYPAHADWGIDQFLLRDDVFAKGAYPGRMAPASALCFVLIGLALLTSRPHSATGRLPRLLVAVPLLVAALALIGYVYGVNSLYAMGSYSGMAVHTAVGFFLLSLAIVAAQPADGFMEVLMSDTTGGTSARRLLPTTTLIILTLGLIRLLGERAGLYGTSFGVALFASSSIILVSVVIGWHATLLHRSDVVRRISETEIVALNTTLEQRVNERTVLLGDANRYARQLAGLLPICAWCKRIRDDKDAWHSVEGYISTHTDTRFTHGMCPDCDTRIQAEQTLTS